MVMRITAISPVSINGIPIRPGTYEYEKINPKDPITNMQLRVYRKMRVIGGFILHEDSNPSKGTNKNSRKSEENENRYIGNGEISGQEENASTGCSDLSERWDSDDNAGEICRESGETESELSSDNSNEPDSSSIAESEQSVTPPRRSHFSRNKRHVQSDTD
jgi:hypothetical protein